MAQHLNTCLYDHVHSLQIFKDNQIVETRPLTLIINDFSDYLRLTLRNSSDFYLHYSANINLSIFEAMRNTQCLDIDFVEFRTHLIDMLHQVEKKEMFLKCDLENSQQTIRLIFFGKSKIKALVFLTIDLNATNTKDLLDEMHKFNLELQLANKNLSSKVQAANSQLQCKNFEIDKAVGLNQRLEKRFRNDLQHLSYIFSTKLQECSSQLLNEILRLTKKLLKIVHDVEIVKTDSMVMSNSRARMLESIDTMRTESQETSKYINDLKNEICDLKTTQQGNEKVISELTELTRSLHEDYNELHAEKNELEKDVKKATKIIAQKTTSNEELAKDVVKANQALVNFNHLFDKKNKEIETLTNSLLTQEKFIEDSNLRFRELQSEFEEYRAAFNVEKQDKTAQEIMIVRKRLEELEKTNRETTKLNELLTRKLASGDFTMQHLNHFTR